MRYVTAAERCRWPKMGGAPTRRVIVPGGMPCTSQLALQLLLTTSRPAPRPSRPSRPSRHAHRARRVRAYRLPAQRRRPAEGSAPGQSVQQD